MISVNARAVAGPRDSFKATTIDRREPGPHDVLVDVAYCGVCHSDIHHARNEWGHAIYPMVPGHEIAGTVRAVGSGVTRFAVGDRAGVGCMVDSCRKCDRCQAGLEQYCREGHITTYDGIGWDGTPTLGGYSEQIVVDERFVLRLPDSVPLEQIAPLLCAGITTWSPLRHWRAGPGQRVAILGLGGLGHVGVQISKALGAHTTALDLSPDKHDDALRLGADDFRVTRDPEELTDLAESFDLIVSTVPANFDVLPYIGLLDLDGTFVNIGVPEQPLTIPVMSLIVQRRSVAGTRIGGIAETQEMLDFCGQHGIGAEVEVIDADQIDAAYERVVRGDVKFRFVIDTSTMAH